MRRLGRILGALVLLLAFAQVFQCERTNPTVTGEIAAPPEVAQLLRRACYDCHSNETVWPWYARVAPVSWLLHSDVVEGRRHVNFSEWTQLPPEKQARRKKACGRQVRSGDMPPWYYLPLHPTARLGDADRALLERWADGG